jgi:hypothetical protein
MRGNISTGISMEKVSSLGLMVATLMEHISITKERDMVCTPGPTVIDTLVNI